MVLGPFGFLGSDDLALVPLRPYGLKAPDPKGPCTQIVYFGPKVRIKGTTLRPKYILFGYMDP